MQTTSVVEVKGRLRGAMAEPSQYRVAIAISLPKAEFSVVAGWTDRKRRVARIAPVTPGRRRFGECSAFPRADWGAAVGRLRSACADGGCLEFRLVDARPVRVGRPRRVLAWFVICAFPLIRSGPASGLRAAAVAISASNCAPMTKRATR